MRAFWVVSMGVMMASAGSQGGQGGGAALGGDGDVSEHILTPGDKTTWPVDGTADEAILVTVMSDVFDPAVELVDAAGRVVAQNDDAEPGNQTARIITDFPANGKYQIRVSNYRSSAGGKYRLAVRRIKITRAEIGATLQVPDNEQRFIRVDLKKDKWYVLGQTEQRMSGYDATGEGGLGGAIVMFGEAGFAISPTQDGAHYFLPNRMRHPWSLFEVAPTPLGRDGQTATSQTNGSGVALFKLDLKRGDAFRVENSDAQFRGFSRLGRATTHFAQLGKNGRQRYVFGHEDASSMEFVRGAPGATLTAKLVAPGQALEGPPARKLALGEAAVFQINAEAFDVERLAATSKEFDAELMVWDRWGREIAMDSDTNGSDPQLSVPTDSTGPLFAVVYSLGYGGGGNYQLTRKTDKPRELRIGSKEAISGVVAFRVQAKAGQVLQFTSAGFEGVIRDSKDPLNTSRASLGDRSAWFARAREDGWVYVSGSADAGAWIRVDLAP